MNFDDLNAEQKDKVIKCRAPEEILKLAKEEGYELSDDELDQIVGGSGWGRNIQCPKCGSTFNHRMEGGMRVCGDCGYLW